jgi:hypothetical protein
MFPIEKNWQVVVAREWRPHGSGNQDEMKALLGQFFGTAFANPRHGSRDNGGGVVCLP